MPAIATVFSLNINMFALDSQNDDISNFLFVIYDKIIQYFINNLMLLLSTTAIFHSRFVISLCSKPYNIYKAHSKILIYLNPSINVIVAILSTHKFFSQ